MMKQVAILLACLLVFSAAQTCGISTVSNIQSGLLNLGVPNTTFAQKEYTITLKGNLGVSAVVHSAFAIAGFQGSCSQSHFALQVNEHYLENSNTKLKFSMNYEYNDNTTKIETKWTRVKLTYLLVSKQFQGFGTPGLGGNYVWAGSASVTVTGDKSEGLFRNGSIFANSTDQTDTCGYLNYLPSSSAAKFDVACTYPNKERIIPHYYIMGFQFAPGSIQLGASAKIPGYLTTSELKASFDGGVNGWGPIVQYGGFSGSLKKLKVAIVLTIIRGATYPSDIQGFSYSGVYMPVELKNQNRPITRGSDAGEYNRERFDLAKPTYQFYGLSSFSIAPSANCVGLDVDVQIKDLNTIIVKTENTDSLSDVFVSGDFYSANNYQLCSGLSAPARQMVNVATKTYATVPDLEVAYQNIQLTKSSPLQWMLTGAPLVDGSKFITYTVTLNYEDFIVGSAYIFKFGIAKNLIDFKDMFGKALTKYIRFVTQIDGKVVNDVNLVGTTLIDYPKALGLTINTATPVIKFTVTVPRPVDDSDPSTEDKIAILLSIKIDQYTTVYNPNTDCCTQKCPNGSGLNIATLPPTCIVCKGDSNLSFDPNTGICSCKVGYYNILKQNSGSIICFPCLAKLCSTCSSTNTTKCSTCVVGADNDTTGACKCLSGFYENNGACKACPAKCTSCSVNGVCNGCSDTVNRKLQNNCDCGPGFYDDGSSVCKTCNALCKTCSSSNTCTSCFTQNNRTNTNGQCVCSSGFYQIVNPNNTLSCRKCSSQCKECSGPTTCNDCNAAQNRISGYDEIGHQTCFCTPGFTALKDGTCVQNGCTADPNCQDCDDARGIKVCIQCIASTNRVLAIPQYSCVCKQGFYEASGVCKACPAGCAKCSNATVCERCAVSATNSSNGQCLCPQSYFFAIEPIRYCKRCNQYCLKCNGSSSCEQCLLGFSATTNGECVCSRGKYVNSNLQCVSCINNCTVCASQNGCNLCASGFFLQEGVCVKRCNIGNFISGAVCEKCQDGCSHCEKSGTCVVCQAGRYAYNGICYVNCPAGSISEPTNMTCIACNSPCGNCVQHPSKCLTCLQGNFFEFGCLSICPVGTYSENSTCKYCSFECASCLGSSATCISCPDGQNLFEGSCYAKCPIPLVNGKCPNICPSGYYTPSGSNNCLKCSDKCKTCQDSADKCTSCASGVASKGVCVQSCPADTLNVNGNCLACAQGCNGCTGSVDKCSACQSGFFLSGTKCIVSCATDYFRDGANGCTKCDSACKTCSAANVCTSCVEARSQPINGVCYSCIYPCSTCTQFQSCTSCLTGFNLVGGKCVSSCPRGSTAVNKTCKCSSGAFQNGFCAVSCSSGFTNINGNCEQCSSDCAECGTSTKICTSCRAGFILNSVSGKCQVNTNCQFGQYFSYQEKKCKRICPTGYSYQDSVCVSECLSGFRDNGFGGCIQLGVVTGCSHPYFYQQGSCVSTCNAGSYPNSASRVCEACSSNCFSCMSSAFCTSCSSGFDMKNSICITGERCANNRLKYNGVCLDSCPVGTVISNGYCERRCDPETLWLSEKCYNECPAGYAYKTDVACVQQCPVGYVLDGKVCKITSQSCPSGQFYNAQNGVCSSCTSPCTQCQYTATYCSGCAAGSVLTANKCVESNSCGTGKYRSTSGSCASCPAKCLECVSATECATCASGYVFNGYDCILKVVNLKEVQMTQNAISRRSNSIFVSVKMSIIPNGLTSEQKNSFFIVIPSSNTKVVKINQWPSTQANTVIIAIEYESYPSSTSTLFLALNAAVLSSSYANVGYTATQNSFLSVIVSNSIVQAPASLMVPSGVTNSKPASEDVIVNKALKNSFKNERNRA